METPLLAFANWRERQGAWLGMDSTSIGHPDFYMLVIPDIIWEFRSCSDAKD